MQTTALVLEDSRVQAEIICKMITKLGGTAIHCDTVRDATQSLTQMKANVLFLDVFVGVHNTLLHLDRFRALAPNAAIVLMTAGCGSEAIEDTLRNARKSGADYVIRKPFNEHLLKDVFSNVALDMAAGARRKHALVIDDSQTVRSFAIRAFDAAGYRTSQADSMEQAFSNVDIAHVDLVLCDVFMPGMGGLQGMRTIKRTWPRVSVISMSAGLEEKVTYSDALNATRKAGADAQIKKPFMPEDLIELSSLLVGKAA